MTCHNAWSEFALAFTVPQLNSSAGEVGNQLHRLTRDGFLHRFDKAGKPVPPYPNEDIVRGEPTFVHEPRGPLEPQARTYLHVNCAHCHRFGGGGGQVVLELDYAKPLKETGLLNVKPKQGDFGLEDARLIAPGAPERSVLYYRMAKFGRGRMPHLGSEMPDFHGLGLIGSWIAGLGGKSPLAGPNFANDIAGKLRDVPGALPFAREFHGANTSAAERAKVLAEAAKLPPGHVRDLFEGYLPPDPKGRKLGSNPRPASILALKGDEAKGAALFFNKELKCANCHKIGDKGTSLGPDLTKIGASRTRAELLDSLLNPSARVEPQYAAYAVRTKDEKAYTGIVTTRNEKELVLIDAEGKKVTIPGDNVETVRPSRLSLMPDGQMSGLTPQEAADLLEFLVRRK